MPTPRQLMGLPCALCSAPIRNIVEGAFCPSCNCPVHTSCAAPSPSQSGACPRCGAARELVEANRVAHVTATRDLAVTMESHRLLQEMLGGVTMLLGGLLGSFVISMNTARQGYFLVATGAIFGGAVLLVRGLFGWRRLSKAKSDR